MDEWGRDEQELVRRCKEGSEAAYAVLVRLHQPRLYALAYRLLLDREGAEDVVQETFIAAFRQMERFEPRPSLAAWLTTIALRTAAGPPPAPAARPRTSIDAPALRGGGTATTGGPGDHLALADADPAPDPHASMEAADTAPRPRRRHRGRFLQVPGRPWWFATSWGATTPRQRGRSTCP